MKFLPVFFMFSILVLACNNEDPAVRITSEITSLEAALGANPRYTKEAVEELLAKYEEYISLKQSDPGSKAKYLMKAGEMASLIKQYDRATGYYDQILRDNSEGQESAKALFMKAYTMDDGLKQYDQAKMLYEQFVIKYPEDDFADDARFLLENLGKSEEEIIKQFEAQ